MCMVCCIATYTCSFQEWWSQWEYLRKNADCEFCEGEERFEWGGSKGESEGGLSSNGSGQIHWACHALWLAPQTSPCIHQAHSEPINLLSNSSLPNSVLRIVLIFWGWCLFYILHISVFHSHMSKFDTRTRSVTLPFVGHGCQIKKKLLVKTMNSWSSFGIHMDGPWPFVTCVIVLQAATFCTVQAFWALSRCILAFRLQQNDGTATFLLLVIQIMQSCWSLPGLLDFNQKLLYSILSQELHMIEHDEYHCTLLLLKSSELLTFLFCRAGRQLHWSQEVRHTRSKKKNKQNKFPANNTLKIDTGCPPTCPPNQKVLNSSSQILVNLHDIIPVKTHQECWRSDCTYSLVGMWDSQCIGEYARTSISSENVL